MSNRHRWLLRGGFALLAALYWGADGAAGRDADYGIGREKRRGRGPKEAGTQRQHHLGGTEAAVAFYTLSRQIEIQRRVGDLLGHSSRLGRFAARQCLFQHCVH